MESRELIRDAVKMFRTLIADCDLPVRTNIPVPGFETFELDLQIHGRGAATAGFWLGNDVQLSACILLAGLESAVDALALAALAQVWWDVYSQDPKVPVPTLSVHQRPAILTLPLPPAIEFRDEIEIIADMETCLAGAWAEAHIQLGRLPSS